MAEKDEFSADEFEHVAALLRRYSNSDRDSFRAVMSNNLSVILAALDQGARRHVSTLACPFCRDTDYDAIGLKMHLTNGHCEAFDAVSVASRFPRAAQPTTQEERDK